MQKTLTMMALALLLAGAGALRAEDAYPGDQVFIKQAAIHDMFEVKAGKVAMENASSPDVRLFGASMMKDHSKLHEQLQLIAKNKGWTLPINLDEARQAKLDQFKELSPRDLDREYSAQVAAEHKVERERFKNAAKYAADLDLRAWAADVERVIKEHNDHVPEPALPTTTTTTTVTEKKVIIKE